MKEIDVKVVLIDEDADNLSANLGITEERSKELNEITQKSLIVRNSLGKVAVDVSEVCKHPNELFIVGMQIGSWYANHHRSDNGLDDFMKMLGKLGKKGGEE